MCLTTGISDHNSIARAEQNCLKTYGACNNKWSQLLHRMSSSQLHCWRPAVVSCIVLLECALTGPCKCKVHTPDCVGLSTYYQMTFCGQLPHRTDYVNCGGICFSLLGIARQNRVPYLPIALCP